MTGAPANLGRKATLADAQHAYIAFLGRPADSRERMQELAAHTLGGIVSAMAGSDEFAGVIEHVVSTGVTPHRTRIKARDLQGAAAWAADIAQAGELSPEADWAELILTLLTSEAMAPVFDGRADFQAAAERLSIHRSQAGETEAALSDLLAFDADWFLATQAGARLGKTADFATALARAGRLPPALAWFTEGLEPLETTDRPQTLGALVRATRKAGLQGELGHWLFDPAFYERQAARSERTGFEDDQTIDPYLAFLAHGDAADVSPHPLFSPFAYRILNPDAGIEGGCFAHFVKTGAAAGLRTSALFDEAFYLTRQPQVRLALAAGDYSCALEHFVRVGMEAGFAFSPDFDRDHYLASNPDVQAGLESGDIPSAEWHYIKAGAHEGRAPNRFFDRHYYGQRYPHVRDEMDRHGIDTTLEHFLLLGRHRGWRVSPPPVGLDVDMDQARALFEKRGRRAYADALAGVFAFEDTPAEPALSVVVPVSGQADFTAGFLKAARWAIDQLELKRGVTTEIVIVDNGSRDHTAPLLDALPGVRRLHFDGPIGFPAAVNAGVAASRGRIVLVANNDITFEADAFLRLFDAFERDPGIGVIGAKVILPNETLQEVGSALDHNGGPVGLGRGVDALDCRGARLVEVDYASGCFVGFTRADFDALSGFDEAYSPGYYEEVDFSLRMKRDLGKPTVVDTGLAITHYEHASFSKGRPHLVNEPLVLRNRERLRQAHAPVFAALRDPAPETVVRTTRQALSGGVRVLFVTDTIPSDRMGSGSAREARILAALTRLDIACDVLALNPSPAVDDVADPLVRLYRGWMPGQGLDAVLQAHSARYSHVWVRGAATLEQAAGALQSLRRHSGLQVICDAGGLSAPGLVEQRGLQGLPPVTETVRDLAAIELATHVPVDLWIAGDAEAGALIEALNIGPVLPVGTAGPGLPAFADTAFKDRTGVLVSGSAHAAASPDHEGLIGFLTDVYPRLSGPARPPVTVAGYWDEALKDELTARFPDLPIAFVVPGSPAEAVALLAAARLAVAPRRFGAEASTDVVAAATAGLPVVMTERIAARLGVEGAEGLAAASPSGDDVAFASWIDTLYADPKAWQAQRALQRERIGAVWSSDRLEAQVVAVFDTLKTAPAASPANRPSAPPKAAVAARRSPRRTSKKPQA